LLDANNNESIIEQVKGNGPNTTLIEKSLDYVQTATAKESDQEMSK
jgi:hypothetical protein